MNSYGDPQSARARARVPGPSTASTPDDDQSGYDQPRPAPDAYRRGAAGRASAGRATVSGSVPRGSASVGNTTSGRASVGAGSARVGSARVGEAYGQQPGHPARASARAAVAPVSPAVAGGGRGDGPSHGTRGSAGKTLSKAAKRRRRTNILTAAAAVVVIMLGGGVVAGTWFFDGVDLPPPKTEDQSNVILDAKGGILAKLGDQNRTVVPEPQINKVVEHAVAAAEDKNFYHHKGIDMKGIARAAWNNFTGGDTQGASTITQQYARHAADLKDISYNRKLREAVIARKLESTYNKDQIMGMYLNYVYLGEGRYGIEAAAQGYFGKSVLTPAGQKGAVTPYEAAVLASIIKQPEPVPGGHKGYDPNINPTDAQARWEYTMKNMLEMKWITQAQYDARKYPKPRPANSNTCKTCATNKPVGMVMRHVRAELTSMGISQAEFDKGGLTVTTTIDPAVQKAAEEAGSRNSKESPMHSKPKTYQAAVIGIDPNNGRVLGYYGGDDPNGTDYAGYMSGDGTKILGGQSPGSSFKIYTLAAGLKEGLSFDSIWDAQKRRPNGTKINNAGADDNALCSGKPRACDLETATIKSYNFPFYWIADAIGRDKVIQAAKDAGVKHMYTDTSKEPVNLTKTNASTWTKSGYFDDEVAFGQYRIPPLEHAEGVATVVGGGVHYPAHFVKSVKRVNPDTGKTEIIGQEKVQGDRVFPADEMSNLQGVMKKIVDVDNRDLRNGREAIAKSGTWEFNDNKDKHTGSGDCWFVGGIPQLAATVWVGGKDNKVELRDGNKDMFGAGTPSLIWRDFINAVTKSLDMKQEDFPQRATTGDPAKFGNGIKPVEQPTQPDQNCILGFLCPPGQNNNGGQGNGGQGNGGQGDGGRQPNGQPTPQQGATTPDLTGQRTDGTGGGQPAAGG